MTASKEATPKQNGTTNMDADGLDDEIFEEGGSYIGDIYIPPPYKPLCSMEANGPRIIITKIINENFKSYYKEQVVGPLHQNFTAVIGPNGSGKSNVIDAMLFVFGYRASNMRTKKVSSLIHNSSRSQNVNSCSVAVVFQRILDKENGTYEHIGEEIEVRRTAFKDNSSHYSVNGKRKTYKEIAVLLAEYGIDLSSNRFLILQGEVEQISLMKPKAQNEHDRGMLEYLEDIIGTTRYKEPIHKLEEKLEEISEEHQHRLNRIKLLQRELKDLEGPKNAAVDYLRKQNELTIVRSEIFQVERFKQQKLKSEFEETKRLKDEKLANALQTIKDLENEKNEKEKGSEHLLITVNEARKKFSKKNSVYEKLNNRNNVVIAEMQENNNQRKKLKTELEKEYIKLEELEKLPDKNNSLISECTQKLDSLEKKKEKLVADQESAMINFKKRSEVLVEERSKASEKLMPLKEITTKILSEVNIEKTKLNLLQSNENKQKSVIEDLEKQIEEINSQLETKTAELQDLTKSKPHMEKKLSDAQAELGPIQEKVRTFVDKIHQLTKQLTYNQDVYQETFSRNRCIEFLMRQKAEGALPGLYGRLGDLGAIDDKFNVAISTACGALDYIVTDDMDTAQKALNMLKNNNIGRATFIALDKQQHLWNAINSQFRSPENAPRLFDLVRVEDNDLRPAFYFALRNTLVGADLDQCMRLCYGQVRHRVVSLKGELFEASGTMSGGGRPATERRMDNKVRAYRRKSNSNLQSDADLQNMEIMRDRLQKEFEEVQARETILEETIRTCCKDLKEFNFKHQRLTMEVKSLKEQQPLVAKNLQQQRQKIKSICSDEKAVKKQEQIIQNLDLKYQTSLENSKELENEVKKLDEKLNDLKKDTFLKVEKDMKNVSKNIEDLKKEIAKLTTEVNNNKRNIEKCKNVISKHETDIKNYEKTIMQLKTEQTDLETQVSELVTEISEFESKIQEAQTEYDSLKSSTSDISKRITELNSLKMDLEQDAAETDIKLKEIVTSLNKINAKLQDLKLEDIPYESENDKQKLKEYTAEELESFQSSNLQYKSNILEEDLSKLKPNVQAIEQYKNKEVQLVSRSKELDSLTGERNKIRQLKQKLSKDRHDQFLTGFQIITLKLKEIYQLITLGGNAELNLVDSMLPFAEGIAFNVKPHKKSWKAISDLSGGEKTLASLSLVLALHYYRPSPLYVMDEIDAALDFRNVSIVANYIKDRTRNAQFIIISLRNNMFDLADRYVCIHKTQDCSKAITINNTCTLGRAPRIDNASMDKQMLLTQTQTQTQ